MKRNKHDSDDDDGFENAEAIEVQQSKVNEDEQLITNIPEANPILHNISLTAEVRLVHDTTLLPSSKYGLSLKELYRDKHLVYERNFNGTHITLDDHFLVKAAFKRNLKDVTYVTAHSEPVCGLTFESNFDSGNLYRAYKVSDCEFDLILQNDLNSSGCTNWFHFSIMVTADTPETITFNCVNFMKKNMLFTRGVQPVMKSKALNVERGTEWFRYGTNVSFLQNKILRKIGKFIFDYMLEYIQLNNLNNSFLERKCPILKFSKGPNKRNIIILSRQHPAETLGSYLLQFLTEQILFSELLEFQWLREEFNWIIVPMVNVDGVELGNARCDALGFDVNRVWVRPRKDTQPIVYALKDTIQHLEGSIAMVLDLHSHSKKMNAFTFGCERNPVECRVFPLLLDHLSHLFCMEQCCFTVSKDKLNTARWIFFEEFKCDLTYTIEVSYGGFDKGMPKFRQINLDDLQKFAQDILKSIFLLFEGDKQVTYQGTKTQYKFTRAQAVEKITTNLTYYQELSKNVGDHSDSDSDVSLDNVEIEDFAEKKTKELKPVKKQQKPRDTSVPNNKKLQLTQSSPKQSPKKTQLQQEKKTISFPQASSTSKSNTRQNFTEVSPKAQKPSPRSTLLQSPPPQSKKRILPHLEKHGTMLTYLDQQLCRNGQNQDGGLRRPKQNRRIQTETPIQIQLKPKYQEKLRMREKLYFLKFQSQQSVIKVREEQAVKKWQNKWFGREKGTVMFSPFENAQRVHSTLSRSNHLRRIQFTHKLNRPEQDQSMYLSFEQFDDHELDPSSFYL